MKILEICLADEDKKYMEAFAAEVARAHTGVSLTLARGGSVSIRPQGKSVLITSESLYEKTAKPTGPEATASFPVLVLASEPGRSGFSPASVGPSAHRALPEKNSIYRYAGATAILGAARKLFADTFHPKSPGYGFAGLHNSVAARGLADFLASPYPSSENGELSLICVFSSEGGVGASAAAIGIAKELSAYRGKKVLYMSFEDIENVELAAGTDDSMVFASEFMYACLAGKAKEISFRDDHGVFRFRPDRGLNPFAGVDAETAVHVVGLAAAGAGADTVVLDFGAAIIRLAEFCDLVPSCLIRVTERESEESPAVTDEENEEDRYWWELLGADPGKRFRASLPYCKEDVRRTSSGVVISLSNEFGMAVKEICDRLEELE
ncbi:MAG: hypothetical protein LBK04_06390 [Clostridiales Family XIII bacterium]|nr:hypothetical protein [Clostridiales Family XIII bacterium]